MSCDPVAPCCCIWLGWFPPWPGPGLRAFFSQVLKQPQKAEMAVPMQCHDLANIRRGTHWPPQSLAASWPAASAFHLKGSLVGVKRSASFEGMDSPTWPTLSTHVGTALLLVLANWDQHRKVGTQKLLARFGRGLLKRLVHQRQPRSLLNYMI